MYSSEDLERFYFQYQTEALPHGESIQSFCVKNKVPYNIFSKWYKDTRKQIVEVKVDGRPSDSEKEPSAFYEQLASKQCQWNKRKAFEKTKSIIRDKYPDPFHWAAFVMLD